MNRLRIPLGPGEEQVLVGTMLREVHGPTARLQNWNATPVSKRGKRRAVRYDVNAFVSGEPRARRHQWVGKYYESDNDARTVASVLRELADYDVHAREGLVVPGVLAYHAPLGLLLLAYESGESVVAALSRHPDCVLEAMGRALAALHRAPVTLERSMTVLSVLDRLRRRIADLCVQFPGQRDLLERKQAELESQAPGDDVRRSFLHGDLGPAQLLWQAGRIVMLDFDKCARGDAALDLGNLLTQLRRLTLRKPDKLPDFGVLRWGLLDAYERWAAPEPGLCRRVAWYEQVSVLRKIHFLASDTTRHEDAETLGRRRAEAIELMGELSALAAPA